MKMELSEIKIPTDFESSTPSTLKYEKCEKYYNETGNQDKYIVVDENDVLVDGYIMYLVLKSHDMEYCDAKRLTLRKHKYTDRQREKYGRIIPPEKVISYKNKPTVYIYGKHPNSVTNKEYMWRVPNTWETFKDNIQIDDMIYCSTIHGIAPVIVSKIVSLDHFDSDMKIKRVCSKNIIRNGELIYGKGESANV